MTQTLAPFHGYTVVEPSWDLEVTPGGRHMNFTGTIQEAIAQIAGVNPDWMEQFNFTTNLDTTLTICATTNFTTTVKTINSHARAGPQLKTEFYNNPLCKTDWIKSAKFDAIMDGINYLHKVKGQPSLPSGPGQCSRVSCSWNSAILWCNDNPFDFSLDAFGRIADGAWFLMKNCGQAWGSHQTGGQAFSPDGWNVIVKYANC